MSFLGLAYVFVRRSWVMKQDAGDGKMKAISDHIYEGALAFLNASMELIGQLTIMNLYGHLMMMKMAPILNYIYLETIAIHMKIILL